MIMHHALLKWVYTMSYLAIDEWPVCLPWPEGCLENETKTVCSTFAKNENVFTTTKLLNLHVIHTNKYLPLKYFP